MSENFLEEMNNALSSGNQIILGRKRIKNWESKNKKSRSWVSNCTALTYIFIDQMGNAFRTKHKIPCNLCGTGMLVRADVIKELGGWPYRTLTEDYEMLMDCILKGFTSMYYKYADVYTEEATAHKVANGRRLRWITGYAQCNKIYGKRIKEKTFDGNKIEWKNFDFLYGLVPVYIFFGISVAVALIGIVSALVLFILKNPVWILALQKGVYALALVYLVLWVYTLIGLVIDREMMKMTFMEKLTVLFVNPIFFSEYLPIFIKAFTKDDDFSWEKVDRIVFDSMEEQLWQLQKKNS
jgi:cellulose synthase/poly-beta-1,6-N-acetylglucosamine synthase-like glycosyltransferase